MVSVKLEERRPGACAATRRVVHKLARASELDSFRATVAASRAGVILGALAFAGGLGMAEVRPGTHAWVVASSALTLFPLAVWISYALAGVRRPPSWFPKVSWAAVALAAAGVAAAAAGVAVAAGVLGGAGLLLGAFLGIVAASASAGRESAMLSYRLGSLASASGALYMILYYLVNEDQPGDVPVYYALGLLAAYPIPLIHAVTIHSLPSTYRDSPPARAAALAGYLGAAAGPAYLFFGERALALTAVMLALYPYTTRAYKAPSYAAQDAARLKPGPARAGRVFYSTSHIATSGLAVASALAIVLYLAGPGYPGGSLGLVHLLAAGFTATHVYIHAPIMLPTVLGVAAGRRFTLAAVSVYSAALSGVIWPYSMRAAMGLASLAWLLSLLATVRLAGGGAAASARAS